VPAILNASKVSRVGHLKVLHAGRLLSYSKSTGLAEKEFQGKRWKF
jgi:hypothetical protein